MAERTKRRSIRQQVYEVVEDDAIVMVAAGVQAGRWVYGSASIFDCAFTLLIAWLIVVLLRLVLR